MGKRVVHCGHLIAVSAWPDHAGGVGTLAVQLAKEFGAATVIVTAGSAEKLKLAS